jgi:hypothetical protein
LERPAHAMAKGEACPAIFLLLELGVRAPSYCIIYGNKGKLE